MGGHIDTISMEYYLCKLLKHLIAKFIYRGKEGCSSGEEKRIVGFNKSQVSLRINQYYFV